MSVEVVPPFEVVPNSIEALYTVLLAANKDVGDDGYSCICHTGMHQQASKGYDV